MSEITRQDLISDDALQAPLTLAQNFLQVVNAIDKLVTSSKDAEAALKGGSSPAAFREETEKLSVAQAELEKIQKQTAVAQARQSDEYIKAKQALKDVNDATKEKIALGDKDAKQVNQQTDSLKVLEAALQKNRKAYADLAGDQARNSKEGKELLSVIQSQDKAVKDLSESIGVHNKEVGNYSGAIKEALGPLGGFIGRFGELYRGVGDTTSTLKTATTGVGGFGVALRAIPLIAIISAIVSLVTYFTETAEGGKKLKIVMAAVGQAFTELKEFAVKLGQALTNLSIDKIVQGFKDFGNTIKDFVIARIRLVVDGLGTLGTAIGLLFDGKFKEAGKTALDALNKIDQGIDPIRIGAELITKGFEAAKDAVAEWGKEAIKNIDRAIELQRMENDLVKERRDAQITEALLERDIANARLSAADHTKVEEERIEALNVAMDKSKELQDEKVKLLDKEIFIMAERMKLHTLEPGEMQKLVDLQTQRINLETEYAQGVRRSASQLSQLKLEMATRDEQFALRQVELAEANAKREVDARLLEEKRFYDGQVALIQQEVQNGTKTRMQGEIAIAALRRQQTLATISDNVQGLQFLLNQEIQFEAERIKIVEDSNIKEKDKAKEIDAIKKASADKQLQLQKQIHDQQAAFGTAEFDDQQHRLDATILGLQKVLTYYNGYAHSISALMHNLTEGQLQDIDSEIQAVKDKSDKDIIAAGDNAAAKKRIQDKAAADEKNLEKQKIEIQRRAAIYDKAFAVTEAGINTALAITKQLATNAGPAAFTQAALAGALGAIQIAAILAKPLPKYEKGTPSAPGGLAIVGEKGPELMIDPSGDLSLTPGSATMMNVTKGTEIIPHDDTMRMLAMASLGQEAMVDRGNRVLYGKLDQLTKAVRESDEKVVNAIVESQTDFFRQGSLLYNFKKSADGSRKLIRQKSFGE